MKHNYSHHTSMNVIDHILVVNLDSDLTTEILSTIQIDILNIFHDGKVSGAILDLSSVLIVDSFIVKQLLNIVKSIEFMGGKVVITGIRPEAVITLVCLDFPLDDLSTALNIDLGIKQISGIPENIETDENIEADENTNDEKESENDSEEIEIQDIIHE